MADTAETLSVSTPSSTRPPFWRDIRVIRVAAQIGTLIVVGLLLRWLFGNLS